MTVVELVMLGAVVLAMGLLVAMLWISQGNVRRWQTAAESWQRSSEKWQKTSKDWQAAAESWKKLADSRRR